MFHHPPSSSLWIHHPQVSIPGAIVSPGNPSIGGKMKDVSRFKRIFNDVYKFHAVQVKIQVSERGMEARPAHLPLNQVNLPLYSKS